MAEGGPRGGNFAKPLFEVGLSEIFGKIFPAKSVGQAILKYLPFRLGYISQVVSFSRLCST
jgi:hypothetical protein